jgi:hypothetical protein
MPRLSLGLGVQAIRKVGGGGSPEPTAVLISGAGTPSSNGNYVWDGITFFNGRRHYFYDVNTIFWDGVGHWEIEDIVFEATTYSSPNLITWTSINGSEEPNPTGTLSYS